MNLEAGKSYLVKYLQSYGNTINKIRVIFISKTCYLLNEDSALPEFWVEKTYWHEHYTVLEVLDENFKKQSYSDFVKTLETKESCQEKK